MPLTPEAKKLDGMPLRLRATFRRRQGWLTRPTGGADFGPPQAKLRSGRARCSSSRQRPHTSASSRCPSLGFPIERSERPLDTGYIDRLEVRFAALLAYPSGQRIPADMIAVPIDAEWCIGTHHPTFAMDALHVYFLRLKSSDHWLGSGYMP